MCRVDCAYNYANSAIHAIKPHFRIYHVAKGILCDIVCFRTDYSVSHSPLI